MRKVKPIKINWIYANSPESEERVQRAYDRIFTIARANLLRKREEQAKKASFLADKKSL